MSNSNYPWGGVDDRLIGRLHGARRRGRSLENPYAKAKAIGDVPAKAKAEPIMDIDRSKAITAPPGLPSLMDAPKAKASTGNKRSAPPEAFRAIKRNSGSTDSSWSGLYPELNSRNARLGDPHISEGILPDSAGKYVQNNMKIENSINIEGDRQMHVDHVGDVQNEYNTTSNNTKNVDNRTFAEHNHSHMEDNRVMNTQYVINLQNQNDDFTREAQILREQLQNHALTGPARQELLDKLREVESSRAANEANINYLRSDLQHVRTENQQNLNRLRGEFQNEFLSNNVQRERRESHLERENINLKHAVQDLTRKFNELKFQSENPKVNEKIIEKYVAKHLGGQNVSGQSTTSNMAKNPNLQVLNLSEDQKEENVKLSQAMIRNEISQYVAQYRRGFPPIQGKVPLISTASTFREWYGKVDHYLTLNVIQPSYYLVNEIINALNDGGSADKTCSHRIKKALYVNWLEQGKWSFSCHDVINKIEYDYRLEKDEHRQRLENTWSTLHFENIRPGETMEELFVRVRELVVSLSHYGVQKHFPEIVGTFLKTKLMKAQKDSIRDAIQGLVLTTSSLDEVGDLLTRFRMIKRAQSDSLGIPGLKPSLPDHVKLVPVGNRENDKNKYKNRFGYRNFKVNAINENEEFSEQEQNDFEDENQSETYFYPGDDSNWDENNWGDNEWDANEHGTDLEEEEENDENLEVNFTRKSKSKGKGKGKGKKSGKGGKGKSTDRSKGKAKGKGKGIGDKFAGKARSSSLGKSKGKSVVCYYCNKPGHVSIECDAPGSDKKKKEICTYCKGIGHTEATCFFKKKSKSGKNHQVSMTEEENHWVNSIHLRKNDKAEKKDFAAILDTGFTGFAVCGQRWLNLFKKHLKNLEGYGAFDFKEQKHKGNLTFTFGMDKVKNCLANAKVPIWIENKFLEIPIYVVDGNLELLLGQEFLRKFQVVIDCARHKFKYGQGKWIAAVLGDKGLLRVPTVPLDTKIVQPKDRILRKREDFRRKCYNYKVNYTEMGSSCPNFLVENLQHFKNILNGLPKLEEIIRILISGKGAQNVVECFRDLRFEKENLNGITPLKESKGVIKIQEPWPAFDYEVLNAENNRPQNVERDEFDEMSIVMGDAEEPAVVVNPAERAVDENLNSDFLIEKEFKDTLIQYLDRNADKLIYNDNTFTRNLLGSYSKILPDEDTYNGYDLTNKNVLKSLVKKIYHNTGQPTWPVLAKNLIRIAVPRKIYDQAREHCKLHDSTKVTGPPPLSRPVAFPMATTFNEVLMLDFFFWETKEVLNMTDAFSRLSILSRVRINEFLYKGEDMEQLVDIQQSVAIVRTVIRHWIGVFGCPRVIFVDPDVRFKTSLQQMCESFHITMISTPSKHHQSFGTIERSNKTIRESIIEVAKSPEYQDMSVEEIISIAQLVHNGFISQVDGQTPGHRAFGRAPRLPIPTAETATVFDIHAARLGDTAPETNSQRYNAALIHFRMLYTRNNTSNKVIKSLYHKNRAKDEASFFIGQTVYFYHADKNDGFKRTLWRGPAIIIGRWDHQALIDYNTTVYRVALERLKSTANCFFTTGVGDESLTLHTQGGAIKLEDAPCSKTLRMFLSKAKVKPPGVLSRGNKRTDTLGTRSPQLEGEAPGGTIEDSRLEPKKKKERLPIRQRIDERINLRADELSTVDGVPRTPADDENQNPQNVQNDDVAESSSAYDNIPLESDEVADEDELANETQNDQNNEPNDEDDDPFRNPQLLGGLATIPEEDRSYCSSIENLEFLLEGQGRLAQEEIEEAQQWDDLDELDLDANELEDNHVVGNILVNAASMSASNKWQYVQNLGSWKRPDIDHEYVLSLENPGDSKEIEERRTWNKYGDAARARELKTYDDYEAIERLKYSDLPKDAKIITGRFVYTMKSDPVKNDNERSDAHFDNFKRLDARLVARGFTETMKEDVAANTASLETMRALFAIAPVMRWDFGNIDVSRAFFQSNKLERDVYMKPPPGTEKDSNIVWKALKPIYGLCDSVKNWQLTVIEWFQELGAKQAEADQAVFVFSSFNVQSWYKVEPLKKVRGLDQWGIRPELISDLSGGEVVGVCAVHVDDIYFSGCSEFIEYFQVQVRNRFKVKEPSINDIMHTGLRVRKCVGGDVVVTSEDYEKCIEEVEIRPERQKQLDEFLVEAEEKAFRSQLGKIMWLARITRADITYEAAAVAQAFAEKQVLEQDYEPENLEKINELDLEAAKPSNERNLNHEGFEHLKDFGQFCNNVENHEINKINLKKKVVKNTGENFKTSLRVKNLVYLNKVIRKIKCRPNVSIQYHDVTNGRGKNDLRLVVYCDASLYNVNDKCKSQIGFFACLLSKEAKSTRDDSRYFALKGQESNFAWVQANPVSWRSFKSPLVSNSSFTSELQALSLGVDAACVFRSLFSELLWGTPLIKMHTEVRGDNISVIRAVQSLSNHITREKRFQSIISTVQQLIESEQIDQVIWVPTAVNISDGLTKAKDGTAIVNLLTFGVLPIPEEEILKKKHFKTHTSKQYLIDSDRFLEIDKNKRKKPRQKPKAI